MSVHYLKYKIFLCLIFCLKISISAVYSRTDYYTAADGLLKTSVNSFLLNNSGLSVIGTNKVTLLYIIIITLIIALLIIYLVRIRKENKQRELIAKQIMKQKEELIIKNKNITDSIIYAKRIQSALMPPDKLFNSIFPDSFVLHIPKDIVSGDFYWLSKVGDRTFVAAVDCTGHGVPGAFISII